MKARFYYLRDVESKPRITRCILQDGGGNVAIGTAICSYLDNPSKKIGKTISFGRATKALFNSRSYAEVARDRALTILWNITENEFISATYKGLFVPHHQYGAYLSEREKQLIGV